MSFGDLFWLIVGVIVFVVVMALITRGFEFGVLRIDRCLERWLDRFAPWRKR